MKNNFKIGVDLTWYQEGRLGGAEFYIKNLLYGIINNLTKYPYVKIICFCNNHTVPSVIIENSSKNVEIVQSPYIYNYLSTKSIFYFLLFHKFIEKHKLDVMFFPMPFRPIFKIKYVKCFGVIHDIQFKIHKKYVGWIKILFSEMNIRNALNNNNKIVTISEAVKNEMVINYKHCKNKIQVVYNAINFASNEISRPICRVENQMIYVGSVLPHKNVITIVKALKILNERNPNRAYKLLLVGTKQSSAQTIINYIENNMLQGNTKLLGYVDDEELKRYYLQSSILLFPSLYEGFGLPIIEAQAVGRLVITSSIQPMVEVAGKGAIFVNPFIVKSIRAGILRAKNDSIIRQNLIKQGINNVKRFWPKTIANKYA